MKRVFSTVGIIVTVLAIAGALGIGHFRLYYGPTPIACGGGQ
ncbi:MULTISPECIES: hypothetical protein [Paraburkholderia]|nr:MULTISPECIES: hypothetical protein [Paraburkholderia]MCX4154971.1 hypothetical protein [Paraburkholderia aspalathi]